MMVRMTTDAITGRVPELTLGWRMRLALADAGISVDKMGATLGYSRSSVSRWLNDKDEPRPAIMAQWALLTGVDRGWLETGISNPNGPPPPGPGVTTGSPLAQLTAKKRARSRSAGDTARYLGVPALVTAA